MSIPFQELDDSPQEHYGPEGVSATRRLIVLAEHKAAMIAKLLGDGYEFGGQAKAKYPGNAQVEVEGLDAVPFHGTPDYAVFTDVETQINTYSGKFWLLTVTYRPLAKIAFGEPALQEVVEELPSGTYMTYEIEPGVENVSIPGWAMYWDGDLETPIDIDKQASVQRAAVTKHVLTFHKVTSPPWQSIRALPGCVNAAAWFGGPAETLRFDGCKASKEFAGLDDFDEPQYKWKLQYTFTERRLNALEFNGVQVEELGDPIGWNHFFRAEGLLPGWHKIVFYDGAVNDANKRYRFPPENLQTLFNFAPEPGEP